MTIADRGTYETLKWEPRKIEVLLHGERHRARYALFVIDKDKGADPARDGAQWMMHRMDPPDDPGAGPMPDRLAPMLARAGTLPHGEKWGFEVKWDGARVLAFSTPGTLCLRSRNGNDVTPRYPELVRPLGFALGEHRAILDGEVVALDEDGRPSFSLLQRRMHLTGEAKVKRLAKKQPVRYVVFDLLWLDGHSLTDLSYTERRERLRDLELDREERLLVPEPEPDGAALLDAARDLVMFFANDFRRQGR
jgi:bifunctional non-homologous end joining protein LigD